MINENIAEQFIRPRAVWNIYVPYEDNPACGKVRPALIVKVLESEIHAALILPIYSNQPSSKYDTTISDWKDIPIDHFSTIKVDKVTTVSRKQLKSYKGMLSEKDWDRAIWNLEKYIVDMEQSL